MTIRIPDIPVGPHDHDIEALKEVLKSNLSGDGNPVRSYEIALCEYINSDHALALSSGSAAIIVALHALGVEPGDEIVVSPVCPQCTVFPILALRAKPIFCDTTGFGFGLNIDRIDEVVTSRTRAVLEVPMWGYPIAADRIRSYCSEHSLPLVFDLAHCHGTKYKEQHLSSYSDIACFSTHNSKVLSTGEGGFLLTSNPEYHERALLYSRFGRLTGKDFGLNYKLSALQAALGLSRLNTLDRVLERRRANRDIIIKGLVGTTIGEIEIVEWGEPNYHRLLLAAKKDTIALRHYLQIRQIPCDISKYQCQVLYQYPIFAPYARHCKSAERLFRNLSVIPVHENLTDEQLDFLSASLQAFAKSKGLYDE